jgi:hypothetical protein
MVSPVVSNPQPVAPRLVQPQNSAANAAEQAANSRVRRNQRRHRPYPAANNAEARSHLSQQAAKLPTVEVRPTTSQQIVPIPAEIARHSSSHQAAKLPTMEDLFGPESPADTAQVNSDQDHILLLGEEPADKYPEGSLESEAGTSESNGSTETSVRPTSKNGFKMVFSRRKNRQLDAQKTKNETSKFK